MINQAGMKEYIENCGDYSGIPIGQDDDDGAVWTALGGKYNSVIVVDGTGTIVHSVYPTSFPGSEEEIVNVVNGLLQ
jgi:hypothetical protein